MTLDNMKAFVCWLKQNRLVAFLGTAGVFGAVETVAKFVHFEGFTLSPPYLLPLAAGIIFLLGTLYLVWMTTEPKYAPRTSDLVHAGGTPNALETRTIFSKREVRVARTARFLVPVIGVICSYLLLPKPQYPVSAVRQMMANVDMARKRMRNDRSGLWTLYRRYASARQKEGEAFWTNPTVATAIPATRDDVPEQNAKLESVITGDLVPQDLVSYGGGDSKDPMAQDIQALVRFFTLADKIRIDLQALHQHTDHADFDSAKRLNMEVCRYWELVLTDDQTDLSDYDPELIRASEKAVRSWLRL